jgi:DNA polymerase
MEIADVRQRERRQVECDGALDDLLDRRSTATDRIVALDVQRNDHAARPSGRRPMEQSKLIETSAADFLPKRASMASLKRAAAECRGCPLWAHATQTVFGEGARHAQMMLVGEVPGDQEDRAGRPFVGPAGRLLDGALKRAGIARDAAYVTNVVKHFKWEARGRRRLHRTPNRREVSACLPWLEAEIELIAPAVLVCLGATSARSLLGNDFKVTERRGQPIASNWAPHVLATIHPSAILRVREDGERERELERFIADLRNAAKFVT